jgi:hypothetical protein
MKNTLSSIVLLLSALNVFAQTDTTSFNNVIEKFTRYYNNDSQDSIFSMFSIEMQRALPIDKTTHFLTGLKHQAGKIVTFEFIKFENGFQASYKTSFERGIFLVNISIDNNAKLHALFVKPLTEFVKTPAESILPILERNITKLTLPFNDEWTVVWGGDTKELNYHATNQAQKNAFDFVIHDHTGNSFKSNGKTNEDYYAFGKELLAPCDGEVVLVVDGIKDNTPGELNPIYIPGNTVIIKTSKNEYLFFAHFMQHSIKVKQGENVKQGDLLGRCGNSGNSSEPHLHFHIQNVENINIATGVKCYFDHILVNDQTRTDYSPIQKDKIKNK